MSDLRQRPTATAAVAPAAQNADEGQPKKNRPRASALRQQRLPACQPILTAQTVIPILLVVGLIFLGIGIPLLIASNSVIEYSHDYTTDCALQTTCRVAIEVTQNMPGPVYIYYVLENYYQNHRRYVKSRNDQQLMGNINQTTDCAPYDKDDAGRPIVPCGAIANSLFNDTVVILGPRGPVNVTKNGMLWEVDVKSKFKNPPMPASGNICDAFAGTGRPFNWPIDICQLPGQLENPDFIIWMRTAALPTFRKLWWIAPDGLPPGVYNFEIQNNYPVTTFDGRKQVLISTASWAGGKNPFLGIAYIVIGSISLLLTLLFFAVHIRFGHSLVERAHLTSSSN